MNLLAHADSLGPMFIADAADSVVMGAMTVMGSVVENSEDLSLVESFFDVTCLSPEVARQINAMQGREAINLTWLGYLTQRLETIGFRRR